MSLRFTLDGLPPAMRAQAEAQLRAVGKARVVVGGKAVPEPTPAVAPPPKQPRQQKPVGPMALRYRYNRAGANGRLLWQIAVHGLPEPVAEYRFHPERRWRFDFAWPDRRIALEVEGLTHNGGRHQRIKGYTQDLQKYNDAALRGWMLIRVTPAMIRGFSAIEVVRRAFEVPRGTPKS